MISDENKQRLIKSSFYVSLVKENYCHALELLLFCLNCDRPIPVYLYEISKFQELIKFMIQEKKYDLKIGTDIFHQDWIDYFMANRYDPVNDIKYFRTSKPSKIVFIQRGKNQKRRLEEEDTVCQYLTDKFPAIHTVCLDQYSVIDQAKLFGDTKILIGVHGAGIANLYWMNKGTCLIEITPKSYFYHDYNKKCQQRDIDHYYVEIEKYEKSEKSEVYPRDCIMSISKTELCNLETIINSKL